MMTCRCMRVKDQSAISCLPREGGFGERRVEIAPYPLFPNFKLLNQRVDLYSLLATHPAFRKGDEGEPGVLAWWAPTAIEMPSFPLAPPRTVIQWNARVWENLSVLYPSRQRKSLGWRLIREACRNHFKRIVQTVPEPLHPYVDVYDRSAD